MIYPELKGKILGRLKNCEAVCANKIIDHIYICLPLKEHRAIHEVMHRLRNVASEVHWIPDLFTTKLMNQRISYLGEMPVLTLNGSPLSPLDQVLKSVMDKVLAFIFLALLSPLMIIIASAVKLTSSGPIFFVQKRHGINNRVFGCLKFRTMFVHEERDGKVPQAKKNDPRITPIGAFLRKSSLDELPQLFNVLKGDMFLVGPRPHACVHNKDYKEKISRYMHRHLVKPGITGWAQVNGFRGETEALEKMEGRVDHDLYYIKNWSIWFDLKILLLTLVKGLWNKNAR